MVAKIFEFLIQITDYEIFARGKKIRMENIDADTFRTFFFTYRIFAYFVFVFSTFGKRIFTMYEAYHLLHYTSDCFSYICYCVLSTLLIHYRLAKITIIPMRRYGDSGMASAMYDAHLYFEMFLLWKKQNDVIFDVRSCPTTLFKIIIAEIM